MASGWRRALAAALVIALALAGLARAAPSADPRDPIPGVHAPICHSAAGATPADPETPRPHDCCDACALLAPALLPLRPTVARLLSTARRADYACGPAPESATSRPRGPRQSQGPPAA